MKPITIRSYKYDGHPRDEYTAFRYTEDAESCTVFVPRGTKSYDYRTQTWLSAPDGLVERYFKTRWYTIWYVCAQHSGLNQMYIHISMPATVTETSVAWVDLDIDYRVHTDGRMEQLDAGEYHTHRMSMAYPDAVHDAVRAACAEIESLCPHQQYPFNHAAHVALYEQITFRP